MGGHVDSTAYNEDTDQSNNQRKTDSGFPPGWQTTVNYNQPGQETSLDEFLNKHRGGLASVQAFLRSHRGPTNWNTPVQSDPSLTPEPAAWTAVPRIGAAGLGVGTAGAVKAQAAVGAVALALSPDTIRNDFNGFVELTITGLLPGETVRVEKFQVYNTAGTIDSSALLEQSFTLTDGVSSRVAGRTNVNVPGDLTGADGAIAARLTFVDYGATHVVGSYVYRMSSPAGRFPAVSTSFLVTSAPVAQTFSGPVRSGQTPVPYAYVVLLDFCAGSNADFIAGTVADTDGRYTIGAAPGTYAVLPIKPGFIATLGAGAVSIAQPLPAGAHVTADLSLAPATRIIRGQVTDTATPLPGVQLCLQSLEGQVTVCYTDAGGNFAAPVGPGRWQVVVPLNVTHPLGCVAASRKAWADTQLGDVVDLHVALTRAKSLIFGYVRDEAGRPISGVEVQCNTWEDQTAAFGITDADGYYTVAVSPGQRWLDATSRSLIRQGFLGRYYADDVPVAPGEAVAVNLTAQAAGASVSGFVRNRAGAGLPGVRVEVEAAGGSYHAVVSAADGSFTLRAAAEYAELFTLEKCVASDYYGAYLEGTLTQGAHLQDVELLSAPGTSFLEVRVTDSAGRPVKGLDIQALCWEEWSDNYSESYTADDGTAEMDVFDGTWSLWFDPDDLAALGYQVPPDCQVTIHGSDQTVDVVLQRIEP